MKININEEDELYNSFDKFEETLSEDLITYINIKLKLFQYMKKKI